MLRRWVRWRCLGLIWGLLGFPGIVSAQTAKPERVFVRVHLDFCGTGPSWSDLEGFRAAEATSRPSQLHQALDRCLDSEFWSGLEGRVWRLAHPKIRPLDTFEDSFRDYALFVHAHTDDRDVRSVLTATYRVDVRVDEGGRTRYQVLEEDPDELTGNRLGPERRAGLLTSVWVLQNQIMFSAIPRTMAAHAYREFLGLDISLGQGLFPVAGEPEDFDGAGVAAPACASCHSTLDPLSYPFSRYNGLTGISGSYDPDRMEFFVPEHGPAILNVPETGMLFGEPVQDLVQWAAVAADSLAYAEKVVRDYFAMLMDREPPPPLRQRLARDLKNVHDHRVERMLHGWIEEDFYLEP